MANRTFKPGAVAIEAGLVCLYGRFTTTGTTGAIASQDCRGFSVAETGLGEYTITLEDNYNDLRMLTTSVIDSVVSGTEGQSSSVISEDVANGSLVIAFISGSTGVVDDLGDGAVALIEITLKNSTVKY